MKTIILAIRALACCGLVVVSSCATSTGDPSVYQARQDFQSRKKFETKNTYTQGILLGSLVGAAAGAVIGAQNDRAVEGALAGGALGAGGGALYANHKVKQREEYAGKEYNLQVAIKNASSTRAAARKFNDVLASKIGAARADKASLEGTLASSRHVMKGLDQELATQKQALVDARAANLKSSDRSRLSSEIRGLQVQRNRLQDNIGKLTPTEPTL